MRSPALLAALLLLWSCAGERPEDTLAAYRAALRARDVEKIWALSDASFRTAYTADDLRAALAASPKEAEETLARMDAFAAGSGAGRPARLELGSGVVLVREDGTWHVASGGLELAQFDTPEHALASFFRAVDAGRWDVARRAIPRRHADAYAGNEALAAYLESIRPRIDRARAALKAAASAVIHGSKAELPYETTKRVTFEREDGTWRIVDLE